MPGPRWHPPVLLAPDRSGDAPIVQHALDRLRPRHVVVVGDPFLTCLAGLGAAEGLQVYVACEDPALRVGLEAARAGLLTAAAHYAMAMWAGAQEGRYGDEAPARAPGRDVSPAEAWCLATSRRQESAYAAMPPQVYAGWALSVAAGCRDGVWRRDDSDRVVSSYHASGDPREVARQLFGGEGWRERAEAAQAWAQRHLVEPAEDWRDLWDCLTGYVGRAESRMAFDESLVLVNTPGAGLPEIEAGSVARCTQRLATQGARVIAWASDATIALWAPRELGTPLQPERLGSLAWARREDGSWLGRSAGVETRELGGTQ